MSLTLDLPINQTNLKKQWRIGVSKIAIVDDGDVYA